MFLESRRVSAVEILNVIWHAGVEHTREDWRYGLILILLLFSVEGGAALAGGHAGEMMVQYPALSVAWLTMEAAALAVMLYAISISLGLPVALGILRKRFALIFLLSATALAMFLYLPWQWPAGLWKNLIAVVGAIAGSVGIGFACLCSRVILARLKQLEPEDLEDLHPLMRFWFCKTGNWGPAKLEALRISAMILGSAIFTAQTRRADHLVSVGIIVVVSLLLYIDDVFHTRAAN
jgi:hypothetical protein